MRGISDTLAVSLSTIEAKMLASIGVILSDLALFMRSSFQNLLYSLIIFSTNSLASIFQYNSYVFGMNKAAKFSLSNPISLRVAFPLMAFKTARESSSSCSSMRAASCSRVLMLLNVNFTGVWLPERSIFKR